MAINWYFNEPWPCAANNSLIQYPSLPKPAYNAVRAAGHWEFAKVEAHTSLKGPGIEEPVSEILGISLQVDGHPEWDSVYELPVTKNHS